MMAFLRPEIADKLSPDVSSGNLFSFDPVSSECVEKTLFTCTLAEATGPDGINTRFEKLAHDLISVMSLILCDLE